MKALSIAAVIAAVVAAAGLTSFAQQQSDEISCKAYDQGVIEMHDGVFKGALESFDKVLRGCGDLAIKAKAHLQGGRIMLTRWPPDLVAARKVAEIITVSPFVDTPTAADAYILKGLVELADGRKFADALIEFKRVNTRVTQSTDAMAEAQFWIGETYRLNHQTEEALRWYQEIPLKYPRAEWAGKALIAAASCQVRLGDFVGAMQTLQRVRRDFPRSPEAVLALQRNTILFRLTMKGKDQEAVRFMTSKKAYRDGVSLGVDRLGQILIAHRSGLAAIKPDSGDEIGTETMTAEDSFNVNAVAISGDMVALAGARTIRFSKEGTSAFQPTVARADGTPDEFEIAALVSTWRGEWLIADAKSETIKRFSPQGRYVNQFGGRGKALRLAQNDIDDVAVLDGDQKVVLVLDRDGSGSERIERRGVEKLYELDSPSDVAFDILGNVYVLDAAKGSIVVFDPRLQFRTTIRFPLKEIKKAVALTVDARGRIYVLDRDGQKVVGYQ